MTNHPNRSQSEPVAIVQTRHYYGPRAERSLVKGDDGRGLIFSRRAEAQAWIDDTEQHVYRLSHGEHGAPDYRIRAVGDLPEYLRGQL